MPCSSPFPRTSAAILASALLRTMPAVVALACSRAVWPAEDCTIPTTSVFLTPQEADPGGDFGRCVAVDGDWIAVGVAGNPAPAGRVELFHRLGGAWMPAGSLKPSRSSPSDGFGTALALRGDTLVVGANRAEGAISESGAAFVFRLVDGGWMEEAMLVAEDGQKLDDFGIDVALDADRAVIGAPYSDPGVPNAGAAYVFVRTGSRWSLETKLVAADAAPADWFGISVDLDGGVAAIGVWGDDNGPAFLAGSVRIFEASGPGWTQTAFLHHSTSPFGAVGGWWGRMVSLRAGRLLFNLYGSNSPDAALLEYTRTVDGWIGPRLVTAPGQHETGTHSLALGPDGQAAIWAAVVPGPSPAPSAAILRRDEVGWFESEQVLPPAPAYAPGGPTAIAFDGETLVLGRAASGDVAPGVAFVATIPPADLDHNGLDDACELTSGLDPDCDGDDIIDALRIPYRHAIDNVADIEIPLFLTVYTPPGVMAALVLNHFAVASVLDGRVHSIAYLVPNLPPWTSYYGSIEQAIAVVYSDPDGDGSPIDGKLLSAQVVDFPAEGTWDSPTNFPIRPVEVGPPGTSFFAGFAIEFKHGQPFTLIDDVPPHRHAGWIVVDKPPLALDDLGLKPPEPLELTNSPPAVLAWSFPIRVNLTDCDGNSVLDACDIAAGLLGDADGDLVPDICDFVEADLDLDGSVDGDDLGTLLGAWGTCPAGPLDCVVDLTGDGMVDGADLGKMLANWTG